MNAVEASPAAGRGWVAEPARWLLVAPPLAVSFASLALGVDPTPAQAPVPYLFDTLTGILLTVAGLLLWARRPGQRGGPLLVAAGYLWYVGSLYVIVNGETLIPYFGFALRGFYDPVLAFVILAFPEDRLTTRTERRAVGAMLVLMIARAGWRLIATPPGFGTGYRLTAPASPILVIRDVEVTLTIDVWLTLAIGLSFVVVATLVIGRLRSIRTGSRQTTIPALIGGAAWATMAGYLAIGTFLDVILGVGIVPDGNPWAALQYGIRTLGPLGLLLSINRLRSRSSRIIEIVAGPQGAPGGSELEAALQAAFDDPSLSLASHGPTGWTGTDGRPIELDRLEPTRVGTIVASAGAPETAIVHDALLLDDPSLLRTLTAIVRLAVDNDRLQADLRAQLEEVRASRARIAEAADAERRRVERDLHDGAQQRLVALLVSLRTIGSRLGPVRDPAVATELEAAEGEVRAAIAEVRELAQGLDPAILREAGLAAALRSLADRAPVPVDLRVEIDGSIGPRAETTAYFVASEALANVAKHAGATRSTLTCHRSGDRLVLVVTDDGRGGADPEGHGLRGLADRVAAVDGTFTLSGAPGGGTTIEVTIPCAS